MRIAAGGNQPAELLNEDSELGMDRHTDRRSLLDGVAIPVKVTALGRSVRSGGIGPYAADEGATSPDSYLAALKGVKVTGTARSYSTGRALRECQIWTPEPATVKATDPYHIIVVGAAVGDLADQSGRVDPVLHIRQWDPHIHTRTSVADAVCAPPMP